MDPGCNKILLLFLFIATLLRFSSAYRQPESNGRELDERLEEYQRVAPALSPLRFRSNPCLLSRLKYYPCTFRQPSTTRVPGLNQYGTYSTTFRGFNCEILRKRHRVGAIPVINVNTDPVFTVSSPGFNQTPKQKYSNNQLSYYNISCKPGQFIFFNVTYMNMQDSSCIDPADQRKKCVDYTQVRLNNGMLVGENCGSDTTGVHEQIFPFDSMKLVFRSNNANRYPGFTASAVCFNTAARKGCPVTYFAKEVSSPKVIQVSANVDVQYQRLRIKLVSRVTSSFLKDKRLDNLSIKILYTFSLSGERQEFRAQDARIPGPGVLFISKDFAYYQKFVSSSPRAIEVPYGTDVTYKRRTLDIVERETGQIKPEKRLEGVTINILHTFSMSGEVQKFQSRIPERLYGPGFLFLANDRAYFQNFLVDTTALQPNPKELQLIADFSKANQKLTTPVELPTINTPTRPCIEIEPLPRPRPPIFQRQKRVISSRIRLCPTFSQRPARIGSLWQGIAGLSDSVLTKSILNAGACNPILKVSATALVNQLKKEDPNRLNSLTMQAGQTQK